MVDNANLTDKDKINGLKQYMHDQLTDSAETKFEEYVFDVMFDSIAKDRLVDNTSRDHYIRELKESHGLNDMQAGAIFNAAMNIAKIASSKKQFDEPDSIHDINKAIVTFKLKVDEIQEQVLDRLEKQGKSEELGASPEKIGAFVRP